MIAHISNTIIEINGLQYTQFSLDAKLKGIDPHLKGNIQSCIWGYARLYNDMSEESEKKIRLSIEKTLIKTNKF